jgi:protein-S-isoprenylcysteine O-methyltransferase Ste14
MYVACVSVLTGEAIFFESTALFIYAFVLFLIFHFWVLIYEEPTLRKKFGASYEEYCREVMRWLPIKKK